jgi:cation:H+ antiporter
VALPSIPAGAKIGAALAVAAPAVAIRLSGGGGVALAPEAEVVIFGAAVVATAFLLAWAAEAAQVDVSGSLATAVLALIAVLPEYAVDLYFAYSAGDDPVKAQYAAANMTGSNRLLIGIGWPLVALVAFMAYRRRQARRGDGSVRAAAIEMQPSRRVEVGFLAAASVFAFVMLAGHALAWWHSAILLGLFGLYLWRTSRQPRTEPDLVGVSAALGSLPGRRRRVVVPTIFAVAAVIALASAEPFAEGLVESGSHLGIDQFLLVQWLAPLASEAPELIVAALFAWRLRGDGALGTLLSSKVNQWTLLVGSLPLAYLAGGGHGALHLDSRQTEEFLLTATQALLAVAVVLDLRFRRREALALLALFLVQFPFPATSVRLTFSAVYLAVAVTLVVRQRRYLRPTVRAISSAPGTAAEIPAPAPAGSRPRPPGASCG